MFLNFITYDGKIYFNSPKRFLTFFLIFYFYSTIAETFYGINDCEKQWNIKTRKDALITFITPSKGRKTLFRTLNSLLSQSNPNWLSIIMFDNVLTNPFYLNSSIYFPTFFHLPDKFSNDGRFCFLYIKRESRTLNCASEVRNSAVEHVKTEWVGFVDDDDSLNISYVSRVIEHTKEYPTCDCILFRMCFGDYVNKPPWSHATNFYLYHVGISFAVKSKVFHAFHHYFTPSFVEDFLFLDKLRYLNFPILLSGYNTYYVNDAHDKICDKRGKHALITHNGIDHTEKTLASKFPCRQKESDPSRPKIVFSKEDNFFLNDENNLQRLKELFEQTAEKCIPTWDAPSVKTIHIIFNETTTPISQFYVQIQLQRLKWRTNHVVPQLYVDKLKNAIQIWDINMNPNKFLASNRLDTDAYFIPSMLLMQPSTPVLYVCSNYIYIPGIEDIITSRFSIYHEGYETECFLESKGNIKSLRRTPSKCNGHHLHKSKKLYCWFNSHELNVTQIDSNLCYDTIHPQKPFDVLILGDVEHFHIREKICDTLTKEKYSVVCPVDVTGRLFDHFVCRARVVVYLFHLKIDIYPIDRLLQSAKVVIAASSHKIEHSMYSPYVFFTQLSHVVEKVGEVFQKVNDAEWLKMHKTKTFRLVDEMQSNFDPLCYAFSHLSESVKDRVNNHSSSTFAQNILTNITPSVSVNSKVCNIT